MYPRHFATLNPSKFFLALSLTALIVLVPLSAFGQRDNKSAKTEAEKPASQETARQQPSPVPVKPDAAKRPEQAASEDESKPRDPMSTPTFNGLKFRSVGPGLTSGRVIGFAVEPNNPSEFIVASASGGVWKTVNDGTTWAPVFDREGSYSIGCITLDPKNPLTVWVGTGENNSQRSVSYGSGVYRSDDGGKTWRNVGLKNSEHIGRIAIDPKDSNIVYVAAQGPLWGPGGDRGLFKTADGGKTWKNILNISENTGVTEVAIDPQNPETVYAASYQRRRHMFTLIDGGPESAIYKSTDAGATWNKLRAGLPTTDMGRIGLAVSPVDTNVIYATIESGDRKGGIFRSSDRGGSWEKRNEFDAGAMYYAHVVADPKNVDRIYVMNVFLMVSDDGGRTLRRLGERSKHVDNHEIWIDPANNDHYLVGCDGGVYESYDRGTNWFFKSNLPVTQFYDITTDNATPFYNVFGGAQDNYAFGGPSRTRNASGIVNADWFVTQGGDGFRTQVDPEDPNTIYAELQGGNIVRDDKRTGERMGIQPQVGRNEDPLRWNWDSPFIISPHSHTRLYFAADKLFRSDDRGDTWKVISGQLSRGLDRDKLPVMGKVWSMDAVAKNQSTAFFGNASALAESPKKDGLIYVGTDDGLLQITEDGGKNWRKVEKIGDVPELVIQRRENDLVVGTFGRGIYILDNYTPLRSITPEMLKNDALFPVKDALMYIQAQPLGGRGKSFQGESFFTAENPAFGATFTYYLKEELKTKKTRRQEAERAAARSGAAINLPNSAELRAEEEEEAPAVLFTITDSTGKVVRRFAGPTGAGIQRVSWDLRYPASSLPPPPNPDGEDPFNEGPSGPLVMPGTYKVSVAKRVNGVMTAFGQSQEFQVIVDGQDKMNPADRIALVEFQTRVARLQRALQGATQAANALTPRLIAIRRALLDTPNAPEKLLDEAVSLERRKNEILRT